MEATLADGYTTDWKPDDAPDPCRTCGSRDIEWRVWEDDAGHEDHEYRCKECGKTWWTEGPDA